MTCSVIPLANVIAYCADFGYYTTVVCRITTVFSNHMCGIAGFVGKGTKDTIEQMTTTLLHRGPDDQGFFVQKNVGFGHTRLSIIDVNPTGHQPMFTSDKKMAIIFNGEIYNFPELKRELQQKKIYNFHGTSDTEVILALYQAYGEKVFEMLNGMFAIALFDFRRGTLLLARDRLGKKPLYYAVIDGTMLFASELKALKKHPLFNAELDLSSLNKYLQYEYVPTPHTIFKNVYKLEPATYLTWHKGELKKNEIWRMKFDDIPTTLPDAISKLDSGLSESVRMRLISDVPLGIFLSGGLDSSTIAYYAQKNSSQRIKTFSIGFQEKSFDESSYARQIAKLLNTEHYEQTISAKDSLDSIPEIFDMLDEPLADASIIPTYLLSKFARQHVTVALGGDGGDELLAGYPTFQAQRFVRLYRAIPKIIRKNIIEKIINSLPVKDTNFSFDFIAKKFIDGIDEKDIYMHQRWLGSFNQDERSRLLSKDILHSLKDQNTYDDVESYSGEIATGSDSNKLLYTYLRTYLMDDILVKSDRASMYNSLEVRAPFLDYKVVDFVNNLPYEYKLKGFTSKYILKKLMDNKLPREIVYRRKKGFGIPVAQWLRGELKNLCTGLLSQQRIQHDGLFNANYVSQLQKDHFDRKKDNRKLLWTLIVFQWWHQKWYT